MNVTLNDFPLKDVKKLPFIPKDIQEVLSTLKGNAKEAIITADGSFIKSNIYLQWLYG